MVKHPPLLRSTASQFLKYGIVGTLGGFLHLAIVYALTEWAGLWYLWSVACSAFWVWIFNFTLNKLWTFRR